jgi:hypothetical protein
MVKCPDMKNIYSQGGYLNVYCIRALYQKTKKEDFMDIYQVIWWNGFVKEIFPPWQDGEVEPAEDEILEEKEFSTAERAVRFMEVENCRRYGELFPEAPCFCFMHFHREQVYYLQTLPYWEAVERILETKEVK